MLLIDHETPARRGKKCPTLDFIEKGYIPDIANDFLVTRLQNPSDRPPLPSPVDRVVDPEVTPFLVTSRIKIVPSLQIRDLGVVLEASFPDRRGVTDLTIPRSGTVAYLVATRDRRAHVTFLARPWIRR
jgi:hypothetical protein